MTWYYWEDRIAHLDQGKGQAKSGGSLSEMDLDSRDTLLSLSRVTMSHVGCTSASRVVETSSSRRHPLCGGHSTGMT